MKLASPAFAPFWVLSLLLTSFACETSTDQAPTDGTMSLTTRYASSGIAAAPKHVAVSADTITVSRARFVIRDIKFKSSNEDSSSFKTEPIVLELDLTGAAQTVSSAVMSFGTFSRIEFDVHRVEQPEIAALPSDQQGAFADFLSGERYSIIIEGMYTPPGGTAVAFEYRSKVDAKQKVDLDPPLVLSETATEANTTMLLDSYGWFRNASGTNVDPRDTNNEGIIDQNLKNTIRVYKDNNKDGAKD